MVQSTSQRSSRGPIAQPMTRKTERVKIQHPEDLEAFSQKFDDGVKRVFSSDQAVQHVKFGSPRDHDPDYGIKAGRLALTG